MNTKKFSKGFTVIELVIVIAFLILGAVLFVSQKAQLDSIERDNYRKTALNAMYYNLEEVYYQQNQYYPAKIDSQTLKAMDPELFNDAQGVKLGDAKSEFRYEPKNCQDNKCKSYTLRADLEQEADFIKNSRNK